MNPLEEFLDHSTALALLAAVLVNGGARGDGGTLVDLLLAGLVRERQIAAPTRLAAAAAHQAAPTGAPASPT